MSYGFDTKKFASALRKDIKTRISNGSFGELPEGFKVSVRSDHSHVWVSLDGVSPEWLRHYVWNDFHGMYQWEYTPRALEILKTVEAMRNAPKVILNGDDIGADYTHCNYYGGTQWSLSIGCPKTTEGK